MNPSYSFLGFSNIKNGQTRARGSLYVFRVGVNCILYYIYEKINIKYTVKNCELLRLKTKWNFVRIRDYSSARNLIFIMVDKESPVIGYTRIK
jgi:hypothetical protein